MRGRHAIDWTEVKARLARAVVAPRPSPEDEERILRRRARLLAMPAPRAAPTSVQCLAFDVAGAPHAVEARHLRGVLRLADLTPVPGAPDLLLGLVPVRGEVVAVFDLPRLLGLTPGGVAPSRLVILGDEHAELAFAVDAGVDVIALDLAALRDPPRAQPLVRGVTSDLVLLDGAALLADERTRIDDV